MKEKFQKLIQILDTEINAYIGLKDLFSEKRKLLKKAKSDDLGVLDNKILAQHEKIKKLNKMRQDLSNEMLNKDANMSQFIELAEQEAPEFKESLEERKVKICKLFDELALLNNQNMELLKHGIIISNKMLESIIDAFAPQGSYYNGAGKTDTHDIDMWTINEEI